MKRSIALVLSLAAAAMGQTRTPDVRWWPPSPASLCWTSYEECQLMAYAAHQAGRISDAEFARLLAECKNGLTACALYEWLRRKLGGDVAAAYLEAIDPAAAAELAELFGDEQK